MGRNYSFVPRLELIDPKYLARAIGEGYRALSLELDRMGEVMQTRRRDGDSYR